MNQFNVERYNARDQRFDFIELELKGGRKPPLQNAAYNTYCEAWSVMSHLLSQVYRSES